MHYLYRSNQDPETGKFTLEPFSLAGVGIEHEELTQAWLDYEYAKAKGDSSLDQARDNYLHIISIRLECLMRDLINQSHVRISATRQGDGIQLSIVRYDIHGPAETKSCSLETFIGEYLPNDFVHAEAIGHFWRERAAIVSGDETYET